MSIHQFAVRILLMIVIAIAASLFGGISAHWWAAAPLALVVTLAFTAASERGLRQKLMGKIGKSIIGWFTVHLIGETVVFALLLGLCSLLFGIHVLNPVVFWVSTAAAWFLLSHEAMGKVLQGIALYLATRR